MAAAHAYATDFYSCEIKRVILEQELLNHGTINDLSHCLALVIALARLVIMVMIFIVLPFRQRI